ncbi:TRAP transporter substrate-binding protein [Azospirillum sp. ST 5-10]|uniref:TRAP transporter substrate-binding protein n=1 Tax=unclassified Azospirillum TaxID=2630922 RepID=UPI003F49FD20
MRRLVLCATAALAFLAFLAHPAAAETLSLKVMGQPVSTGLIQKTKEQPFFEDFAARTGIDTTVDYKPLEMTGIKDSEQLRVLKSGLFDIISLRLSQVSRDEPTLLGLDLVGLNPTYETGRKTVEAYKPYVDARLQERFHTKLLGVWPFGPQVFFCQPEIKQLADLKGKKVRVYDQNLANFVASLGGTAVPISFPDVQQSLARGVVDCAITGPSSANSAGWPEVSAFTLPIGVQLALNGYGINLDTWNRLSAEQQGKLQAAFDALVDDIWTYSKHLFDDAMRCNVGKTPCETVKPYALTEVPITDGDLAVIKGAVKDISFPTWAEACDKVNPTCSADWKKSVGPLVGF